MRTLNRYMLKEIIGALFFGFVAFLSIFLGLLFINLLKDAEKYHLSIGLVFQLLALRLPQYITQASPIAVLLATLLGLGNLTSHSETIAMRAGGMSHLKLAMPVILIGLFLSISGVLMNEFVVPESMRQFERIKKEAAEGIRSATIWHFDKNFFDPKTGQIQKRIYAEKYEPATETLHQVLIEELQNNRLMRVISTTKMEWRNSSWFFNDGLIYHLNDESISRITAEAGYIKYPLRLTPKEIIQISDDPENQSISGLGTIIKFLAGADKRRLLVDWHLKFSIPFASLILALLGAPLALKPQRRSSAAGFGLCMIFILIWYGLMGLGTYMARAGLLPPFIGAWFPNFMLGGYGIYVFAKAKS